MPREGLREFTPSTLPDPRLYEGTQAVLKRSNGTNALLHSNGERWVFGLTQDAQTGELVGADGALWSSTIGDAKNRAFRAWRSQPKTYKLAVVPEPTVFVDFNRGNDTTGNGTRAQPFKTLDKLTTTGFVPAAGACVALANDSLFDLTTQITFLPTDPVNGASETNRVTFTNYDPGGFPSMRPRIRFRFLPTSANWTWDATYQAWYYTHPAGRAWGYYTALCRFSNGTWGQSRSTNTPALSASLFTRDGDFYADDATKRLYLYAPSTTDPTTYYGGPGSVILGETERGALQFARCGNYVTIDNIIFEDCGLGVHQTNVSGTGDQVGMVVQRCQFINVGRGVATFGDTANYTNSLRFLENVGRNAGSVFIHFNNKAHMSDVAGNMFFGANQSSSHGGSLYAQGTNSGIQTMTGNRCFENYVEGARFNRGNCSFDGAGLYFEARAKGWDAFKNFVVRCHHGICNNTGNTFSARFNVFDDVDIPYIVGDGSAVNQINSTFEHNTAINCGITKWRIGDSAIDPTRAETDPLRAAVGIYDGLTTTSVFNHRNNLIHLASGAPAVAGMEVRRSSTFDMSGNHFAGAFSGTTQTYQFGTANAQFAAPNTSIGLVTMGQMYEPLTGVSTAPVISTLPSPLDLYGAASPQPAKGAVCA